MRTPLSAREPKSHAKGERHDRLDVAAQPVACRRFFWRFHTGCRGAATAAATRPANEAAAKLAPVAPPPIPAAVDKLPVAKLKLPPGFNIEVYASGMANARSLALGDKGTVFVGSRLVDKVYAIVNKDGQRSVKVLASGLYRPNGLAFNNGTLYIAELSKISQIEK